MVEEGGGMPDNRQSNLNFLGEQLLLKYALLRKVPENREGIET